MADGQASSSKRRKGSDGQAITISVSKPSAAVQNPALAVFPAAKPPPSAPFAVYSSQSGTGLLAPSTVVAAETQDMEYESRNHARTEDAQASAEAKGYSVNYMIGVRDKRSNTLSLHAAPLHTFQPIVKSLKDFTASSLAGQSSQYAAQKAALGSAFGTKKAIRQLNAQARNKLTSDSYGTGAVSASLQSHLQSTIAASSSTLPTTADIEHEANLARPTIPPPNFDATKPDAVYDVDDVVSQAELNSIDLDAALSAKTFKDLQAVLPYRRSKFLSTQLRRVWSSRPTNEDETWTPSRRDRDKLKLVIHASQMFAFRQAVQGGRDAALERAKMQQKLNGASTNVVDAMLDRYSEQVGATGGSNQRRKFTSTSEMKLLGYLLVLVLKLDGWSTDVTTIANDLGMGTKKVGELFRSLGCKLVVPSAADVEKLVQNKVAATKSDARKLKQAVLKVPLEFPVASRGPAKR